MSEGKLRTTIFSGMMAVLVGFLVPFEVFNWWDSALMLYSLCLVFINICLVIWGVWWRRAGSASDMFIMVWLLLVAIDINFFSSLYARWQFVYRREEYLSVLCSDWWAYRVGAVMVVLGWFTAWSIVRYFHKGDER